MSGPIALAALLRSFGLSRKQAGMVFEHIIYWPAPSTWEDAWENVEAAIKACKKKDGWDS